MKNNILNSWITDGTGKPFYARKEFVIDTVPEKATVYVCGLGQFQLYINGKKVGDHVLDPAWTDYKKLICYVKFDITDMLQPGNNVIAAEVGNGWYLCDTEGGYFFHFPSFMPPNPNPYRPFDRKLVLAVRMEIEDAEGSVTVLETDDTWKVAEHPIQHSNCFGSEVVDGRKKIPAWNEIAPIAVSKEEPSGTWKVAVSVPEKEKSAAEQQEQTIPPVRVIDVYDGKYLGTVNGRAIYDFSQNVSGMLEFEVKGECGEVIHAYPAEKLTADGDVDQMAKNWILVDVCETYIIGESDIWEKFAMTFTYFGGRYLAIDCKPEQIRNIRLKAISSAGERAGTFWCDDERYMKIYDLVEKAVEANMLGVHTDCPTIERFAWQEGNHLMAPAVMYMKKVKPHWEKFLKDARVAQHTKEDYFHDMEGGKFYPGEGLIPSQAPCYIPNVIPVPGMGDFYNVIGWGSSIILGTWWHYQFYGDEKVIRENYDAGKRYLEHLKTKVNADGFIEHGLGDWGNPAGQFAKANVETAFLYADAKILKQFAEILGKEEDAKAFAGYAEAVKENYNKKLLIYDETGERYCYRIWDQKEKIVTTQATQAMPLFWGMVPDDRIEDVVKSFQKTLEDAGTLQTGEVAQPYIIQTMSRYGMNDLLCEMILKSEHPSYYAFVLAGETTLGEYWEENPRSHCHDMMGHIAEWYYNGIAGIRPMEPGFKKVLVKPYLSETMHEVRCHYDSASGLIDVRMKREGEKVKLYVDAADGIELQVDESLLKSLPARIEEC